MTNHDRWHELTKDLGAPAQFLKFAFYQGISTALERRVYYGDLNRPLFCNNYTLLVGPAGVGKGQSMREVKRIIGQCPLVDAQNKPVFNKRGEPEPLFQPMADTMTFEAVIQEMARKRRTLTRPDGKGLYEHASFYAYLEELSSFLRVNKADDVARLLLNLYDASEPFRYVTKKAGDFEIRSGCLNLMAGTTLDFLAKAEQSGMLGEGLFSRMMIVYAEKREHDTFEQHQLTDAQVEHQTELRKHFFRLGHLFGPLRYNPDTLAWLENWWKDEIEHLNKFGDEKLANFFSRRKVQVLKLAAAIHFSENFNNFTIEQPAFEEAARLIRTLEEPIIRLARRTGKNTNFGTIERLVARMSRGAMSNVEVLEFLSSDMDMQMILQTLQLLTESGRITRHGDIWKICQPNSPASMPTSTAIPQLYPDPTKSQPLPVEKEELIFPPGHPGAMSE